MTEYEEYIKLYYERYGDSGPSISISALKHKANPEECGCYECQLIELREWKKENEMRQKKDWGAIIGGTCLLICFAGPLWGLLILYIVNWFYK